jgi:small-conductance mechanosensitive channel
VSDPQAGVLWRNLLSWTLYVLLGLVVAANLGINLSSLLFGGAIIGIVIAAAAQASLGNFFAGLVLLMARPYRIGAPVRIHALSVDYEGTIVDQNALYLTMRLADGEILRLPNQAVITSPIFTGRPPIQATMSLVLPAQAQLEQLRRRIENQLSVARAVVTLTPQSLDGTQDGKLNCELEVRCAQPVALSRLTEALQAALNDPAPETPSLETAAATPRTPPEGSTTSPRPARARRA